MLLFWRIRYLDTCDKSFKDRDLWLDTIAVDPTNRAAIEAIQETKDGCDRRILRFRHLFQEEQLSPDELSALCEKQSGAGVFLPDYFEDENGNEISSARIAQILSGSPDAIVIPSGIEQHDINYILAEKRPVLIDSITLTPEQLRILGYFARDIRELSESAFFKDGPGTISSSRGSNNWALKTAISDEEIRSFVTIFRRLYMAGEPANFLAGAEIFRQIALGYPVVDWVFATAAAYKRAMDEKPDCRPMLGLNSISFSRKRLIDVFLYTQFAHQPDDRRSRQFQECLASVGGSRALLTWLFLTEIWKRAIQMRNAGLIVAQFYDCYCKCHSIRSDVVPSLQSDQPGLGALEKKEVRQSRVFAEKADELAQSLWESAGQPAGGHKQFVGEALERLKDLAGEPSVSGRN